MRNVIPFLLIAFLFSSSCKKSEDDFQFRSQPDELEDIPIDIDKDGETDFIVTYTTYVKQEEFEPVQMIGAIEVIADNAIFSKEEEPTLFLEDFEAMDYFVEPPYYWSEAPFPNSTLFKTLVSIERYEDPDKWPLVWKVETENLKDEYLIGVKIRDLGGSELMGFIKISIDEVSGQVTILEAELL